MADELPPVIARLIADTADFIRDYRAAAAEAAAANEEMSSSGGKFADDLTADMGRAGDAHDRFVSNADGNWDRFHGRLDEAESDGDGFAVRMGNAFNRMGMRIGNAFRDGFGPASENADKATRSTNNTNSSLLSTVGAANDASGAVRKWGSIVTAAAGPASAGLLLGIPAMFGAIGVAAEKSNSSVVASFDSMKKQVSGSLAQAFAPIVPMLRAIMVGVGATFQALAPAFRSAAQALAPILSDLWNGINGFLQTLIPALANGLRSIEPVVQALADGLQPLAAGLAGLFRNLNVGPAAQGLRLLFNAIGQILPVVGQLLSALAPVGNAILKSVLPGVVQLAQSIGNALAPVLKAAAPVMGQIGNAIADVAKVVGQLFTALAPLIKPVLQIVAAFLDLVKPLGALSPLFDAIAKAFAGMAPVLVQIAKLVADFLGDAFTKLAKALPPLMGPLGELAKSILTEFLKVLTAIEPSLGKIIDAVVQLAPSFVKLVEAATKLVIAVTPIVTLSWQLAGVLAGALAGALGKVLDVVINLASGLVDGLASAISGIVSAFEDVPKIISAVGHWFASLPGVIGDALSSLGGLLARLATDAWHGFTHGLQVAWTSTLTFLRNLPTEIPRALGYLAGLLTRLAIEGWNGFTKGITTAFQATVAWFQALPGRIGSFVVAAGQWLLKAGQDLITGLGNGIVAGFQAVVSWFVALPGNVRKFVASAGQWLTSGGTDLLHGLWNGIVEGFQAVVSWFASLPGTVIRWLGNAGQWLIDAGRNIVVGLWNGITAAGSWLMGKIHSFVSNIISSFESGLGISSPSKITHQHGQYLAQGLANGMLASLGIVQGAAGKLADAALGGMSGTASMGLSLSSTASRVGGSLAAAAGVGGGQLPPIVIQMSPNEAQRFLQGQTLRYNLRNTGNGLAVSSK